MSAYDKTFEWIDFPEGRVQYSGSTRGRDEPPIRTFAIEFRDNIYYGQIEKVFLPDRYNYNLEVMSFGWPKQEWLGSLPEFGRCAAFTVYQAQIIQKLICQAVRVWQNLEDRPSFLTEFSDSHFMGDILFHDGWMLIKDQEVAS